MEDVLSLCNAVAEWRRRRRFWRLSGARRFRSVPLSSRDRGHPWLGHDVGRESNTLACDSPPPGGGSSQEEGGALVTAGCHGAHRGTSRGWGCRQRRANACQVGGLSFSRVSCEWGWLAPAGTEGVSWKLEAKRPADARDISRLHRLTRGAFSAAPRVLARATQSGSGLRGSPKRFDEAGLLRELWTRCSKLWSVWRFSFSPTAQPQLAGVESVGGVSRWISLALTSRRKPCLWRSGKARWSFGIFAASSRGVENHVLEPLRDRRCQSQ